MAGILEKFNRNVIPRWRTFAAAIQRRELALPFKGRQPTEDSLLDQREAWEHHRTIWHATDLLGTAVAVGKGEQVKDVAKFIIEHQDAPQPAKRMALRLIASQNAALTESNVPALVSDIKVDISAKRKSLNDDPRNAIQWLGLARDYTIVGLRERAERAIKIALNLNNHNRFILRSAARFYIHDRQPDRASEILRAAPSAKTDPWLIAAEIATAESSGGASRLVDIGRKILRAGTHEPFQTAELASAIATLELVNGKARMARDLFRTSLIEPTENSLAQAEWALDKVKGLELNVQDYEKTAGKYEAAAWDYFGKGSWELSLANAKAWLADQPFSSRPAMLASYVAICMQEKYAEGIAILNESLRANRDNHILLNNLAFGLAVSGQPERAAKTLSILDIENIDKRDRVSLIATQGLIEYRKGNAFTGRSKYYEALKLATDLRDETLRVRALIFFAQEEVIAKTPDAEQAAGLALKAAEGYGEPQIRTLLALLKRSAGLAGIQV